MKKSLANKIKFIFSFIFLFTSLTPTAHAGIVTDISGMIRPLINLLNLLTFFTAVVFLVMLAVTTFKFAMSQGDPKAMEGSRKTLTLNIIGFIVAGGAYAIIRIALRFFGIGAGLTTETGIQNQFEGGIGELFNFIVGF